MSDYLNNRNKAVKAQEKLSLARRLNAFRNSEHFDTLVVWLHSQLLDLRMDDNNIYPNAVTVGKAQMILDIIRKLNKYKDIYNIEVEAKKAEESLTI